MIFTLGVDSVMRGLMVAHTGGFAPQTEAVPFIRFLAVDCVLGIPVAIFVRAGVSILIAGILLRTSFDKSIYSIGPKESAAYLSGIRTKWVIVGAFVIAALCAATAGILLAGYSAKAYQGMGGPYLLPMIVALHGGTHILGGRGRYIGTLVVWS